MNQQRCNNGLQQTTLRTAADVERRSVGYNEQNVSLLKESLLAIAHSEEILDTQSSEHGVKYVIEGLLQTPAGGALKIRTIWIIDEGQDRPRFVTAYPVWVGR